MTLISPPVETSPVPEALAGALRRLDPATRHVCAYALGLCSVDGTPSAASGKGVRGTLALLSARAAGAPADAGLPAAVAVELVHNFSLVHDDLMDNDLLRRHRPSVWAAFGVPSAVLAGDAMLALATEVLVETGRPWAEQCLAATTRRLIAGQMADLALESTRDVALPAVLAMAGDKTAALLACAASLGAVVVDAPPALALGLAEYGTHLGLAFQLCDDLLGIWGDPVRTGKPVLADLRARKKSLPVAAALTCGHPAAGRLAELYLSDEELTDDQLGEVAALVVEAGGRDWTQQRAAAELDAALAALAGLDLPADVAADLTELAEQLAGRDC